MDKIEMENWRNKNKNTPASLRRSKKSILNPHDIDYEYDNVPLLKNAYTSSRKIKRKIVDVFNSCAFDCTFSIYSAAFLDNITFRPVINHATEVEQFSNMVKKLMQMSYTAHQCSVDKTALMYELFSKRYKLQVVETKNTISIDGHTTYGSFLKSLFADIDSSFLYSLKEINTCPKCDYTFEEKNAFANNKQLFYKIDLKHLSKYIRYKDTTSRCRKCMARLQTTVQYSNILAFDVEPLTKEAISQIKINDVQKKLHMNENVYDLFAVVEFKETISGVHHFIAHIKRADGTWETYDDLKKAAVRSRHCATTPISIFAVFYKKL